MNHIKLFESFNASFWNNDFYDNDLSSEEIQDRINNRDKLVLCSEGDAYNGLGDNDYYMFPYTFCYVDDPDNPNFYVMIQYDSDSENYIFSATNHWIVFGIENWEDALDAGLTIPNKENKLGIVKKFDTPESAVSYMRDFLKKDRIFYFDHTISGNPCKPVPFLSNGKTIDASFSFTPANGKIVLKEI